MNHSSRLVGVALGLSTLVALVGTAHAEESPPPQVDDGGSPPTLIGPPRNTTLGGYLSLGGAYTNMLNRDGGLVSLEAALLFKHRLSLGVAGYAFSETPSGPADVDGTPRRFGTGYVGLAARYSFFTDLPVYATVGFVMGGGVVALGEDIGRDHDRNRGPDPDTHGFFVFQPEVSLQSNVTRWLRVGVDGGYRMTSSVQRFGLDSSDLNGVVFGGHVQVGWL